LEKITTIWLHFVALVANALAPEQLRERQSCAFLTHELMRLVERRDYLPRIGKPHECLVWNLIDVNEHQLNGSSNIIAIEVLQETLDANTQVGLHYNQPGDCDFLSP
jgi:hypothetical protein